MGETIFVFGSNLAGRHGRGAALYAKQHHGAIYGQGEGLQGTSYALPTCGWDGRVYPLTLPEIHEHAIVFIQFADSHPEMRFQLTRVGCGLAGYTDAQIAPFFEHAPPNVEKPEGW